MLGVWDRPVGGEQVAGCGFAAFTWWGRCALEERVAVLFMSFMSFVLIFF